MLALYCILWLLSYTAEATTSLTPVLGRFDVANATLARNCDAPVFMESYYLPLGRRQSTVRYCVYRGASLNCGCFDVAAASTHNNPQPLNISVVGRGVSSALAIAPGNRFLTPQTSELTIYRVQRMIVLKFGQICFVDIFWDWYLHAEHTHERPWGYCLECPFCLGVVPG